MTTLPSFGDFFTRVHGYPPFPWQERLVDEVLQNGWPDLLDLPTGAGKTSALDVALYSLAARPDRMPRRTVLVVDRRIVVDQGADHARNILAVMRGSTDATVKAVADALRAIWSAGATDDPFAVAVMRGGMPRENDWARRPDQPVLGVSTVDQVGSRLLFRGYGISPRSASIHAGLLGNDTLILLDEVHLAVPFAQTLSAIRTNFRRANDRLPDRFAVVRMSATAGAIDSGWRIFALAQSDRANPVLSQRLTASKIARLRAVKTTGDDEPAKRRRVAEAAVDEALSLQSDAAPVVAIVINRVDTARIAFQILREKNRDQADVQLVTGRMRAIDRDRMVRQTLWPRVGPRQGRTGADRPLIVVATQCIEAGADLDFDAMVTECASLDSLRQRFGRLDRQGVRRISKAVILSRTDATAEDADDPIYGKALSATWSWLRDIAHDETVDFGIDALPVPTLANGDPRLDLIARPSDAPVLLPAHLDAWAQTSPLPAVDPDVSLWLHGPEKPTADVQIVWRSELVLPQSSDAQKRLLKIAIQSLSARRPSSLEALSVPIAAARRWLAGETASAIADVMGGDEERELEPRRTAPSGRRVVALRWAGDESNLVTENQVQPGDVLIVPCERGGIAASSFDQDSKEPVVDLGDLAQLRTRGVASLLLSAEALAVWQLPDGVELAPAPVEEESVAETRQRVRAWIRGWPSSRPPSNPATDEEWTALINTIVTSKRLKVAIVRGKLIASAPVLRRLRSDANIDDLATEDDDSSFQGKPSTLRTHCRDVRRFVEQFSASIGLSPELVSDLSLAGWLHDVGKADPRFQRWLAGGSDVAMALFSEPLAKSALPGGSARERSLARKRAGYPPGYRHEMLSLSMVEESDHVIAQAYDRDLVLHLIGSHHGWCRPFAPMVDHPQNDSVVLDHESARVAGHMRHQKARLDSGVGDRFCSLIDRYGWWELAWLESVIRLADHRASEMEAQGSE